MKPAATSLLALAMAGGATHFDVQATFVPATPAGEAAVAVFFTAKDPDVNINESPAPRLTLDSAQSLLTQKPRASKAAESSEPPAAPRYLDLSSPVRFPVAVAPGASKGARVVKGSVAYFYCSKREGWCRKGTTDLEIPVLIR